MPNPNQPGNQDYYSFERVLKELQIEEDELKRLVSEGEIRAFRDEDKMKFRKSDIDGLKKGRMTEPTIILPSGEPDDSSEDSEVLLVEDETSETLLDIDDLHSNDPSSSSTSVPTVDLSGSAFEEEGSTEPSGSSETTTEELTFEDDSYVSSSSDDVLIDSSGELDTVSSGAGAKETPKLTDTSEAGESETFIDSDTGLQTEPLNMDESVAPMDLDKSSAEEFTEPSEDQGQGLVEEEVQPAPEPELIPELGSAGQQMVMIAEEEPLTPGVAFCLIAATLLLLFSGVVAINAIQETDTPATGWLTDAIYRQVPAKHLYKEGKIVEQRLNSHLEQRKKWRNE